MVGAAKTGERSVLSINKEKLNSKGHPFMINLEDAKKVITRDASGKDNGWLMEMFKSADGNKTEVYLSAALPGAFKGYHLHRVRAARYVCLKGRMKIITYEREGDKWVKSETILDGLTSQRLFIPKNVATGLENIGDEEGWLVNYPDPAYDPSLTDEQVEYTQEELEAGVVK
jgi:dTDP-4-dehydrorhamnose 3,5-epimerase-like enzyme